MTKICSACGEDKSLAEYGPQLSRGRKRLNARCRPCLAAYARVWRVAKPGRAQQIAEAKRARYAADPEVHRERARAWHASDPDRTREYNLRRKYGIGLEQYSAMLRSQGGCCAVCRSTDSGDRRFGVFAVDHDHATGAIRGLLCARCNRALGHVQDDVDRLMALAAYLLQNTNVLGKVGA